MSSQRSKVPCRVTPQGPEHGLLGVVPRTVLFPDRPRRAAADGGPQRPRNSGLVAPRATCSTRHASTASATSVYGQRLRPSARRDRAPGSRPADPRGRPPLLTLSPRRSLPPLLFDPATRSSRVVSSVPPLRTAAPRTQRRGAATGVSPQSLIQCVRAGAPARTLTRARVRAHPPSHCHTRLLDA